jgi:hypothetical protein
MSIFSSLPNLAGTSVARGLADRFLAHYARHRVRTLDGADAVALQQRTLGELVRNAADTRFGRDHDFGRIRSVADYQRLVPLRSYEDFWAAYWEPAFPDLDGVTWQGRIPYFALSSGTTTGTTKYIPVSWPMLASNRRAALTALSVFLAAHSGTPIFSGRIFFLGGSTALVPLGAGPQVPAQAGDLSGIAAREVSAWLRPYTFPPLDLALISDWEDKIQRLAEQSCSLPITVVSGVPSWLLVLFDRLKRVTGKSCVADVWPKLRLIVHGGTKFDPYRALFRREVGSDSVVFLETYPCSEGFVAAEDPRHGLLRLIPDHGLFFEFVPVAELGEERPARHTLADLQTGVQYAIAVTTCAGLWSYLLGDTVCFERRDPPLLRFTGRTKYCLSAFGEHLINEEVEKAMAVASEAAGAAVVDFHVGPLFPEDAASTRRHRYLVEFASLPTDLTQFATELDTALERFNDDYRAHRQGGVGLGAPEVVAVPRGTFAAWLRSRGQLGGQHKVPRMDGTGRLTLELTRWYQDRCLRA